MNTTTRVVSIAVCAVLLGACASGGGMYSQPYALFEAAQRMPAEDQRPAFVLNIDGKNVAINTNDPVEPGKRTVELSVPGPAGMSDPGRDTLVVDAKPCTRYYFAARRSSLTARDWKAFVASSEPIGDCTKRFSAAK
jgi:hypothetical protein